MRINFDRLSQLAGLPANSKSGNLNESAMFTEDDIKGGEGAAVERDPLEELDELEGEEGDTSESASLDEMIEVDEVMLVQELRRAKRIMQESKRRSLNESRRRNIFEAQLKQVIDEEVQNVMDEMNLTSQWVYGNRRPTRSRKGYTNQGSIMPGFGFKR